MYQSNDLRIESCKNIYKKHNFLEGSYKLSIGSSYDSPTYQPYSSWQSTM